MSKLGVPREQFCKDDAPAVIKVIADAFNGEIMVINADAFDEKTMKRVNDLGQLIDDKGRVMPESMPKSAISPGKEKPEAKIA